MDNQRPLTPEGFRTAAYLAARARLDARKTTRNLQCNPPNVKCGGRCIPPTWDCRLKGQGTDPHLRAVKTDPLGGLANIQRGATRIAKGVTRGNFSEVHGGREAIVRGVVKITPGNLQQKKELERKLKERTRLIGTGLAVVTLGLGTHALLMKTDTFGYRNGVGANINNATRLGVSRVLDAVPVVGANRARVRAAVAAGIQEQVTRQANPASAVLTGQLARTQVSASDTDARTNLVKTLQAVNSEHGGAGSDFGAWDRAHQRAFWGVTRVENGVGLSGDKRGSIFARPATDEFLARQFNLQGDDVLTSKSIKDAVERHLGEYKSNLLDLAQQQGYRVTSSRGGSRTLDSKDQRAFIQGVVRGTFPAGQANDRVRAELTKNLEETLTRTPKGQADAVYRQTFGTFNEFYTSRASAIESASSASRFTREMRRTGVEQTMMDGRQARAQYVLGLVRPGSQVQGPAHAELALREYHAREVVRTPRSMYTVSDRLATTAASEIAGRPVGRAEAFQILEREGFTGAVPRNAPTATSAGRQGLRAQASLSALARQIMARQGNEGMTLEAALRAARRERGDADDVSPELVRTAVYLAARADFQEGRRLGKPCGASHIPKAHECRKGQGATQQPAKGGASRGRAIATAVAVTAGAGLTVGGLLAYRNRATLVPGLSQDAIRSLSTAQVKAGLDKLPEQFREPARKLVGDAKLAAAHMALRAQGAQIKAVDVDNNFSTWVTSNGTHLSIGSVGDSLLTFGAERKANIGKFPQFGLGFTINTTYDAEGGMPSGQARQLIRTTKAMYKAQLDMLPDDAFLFAVPHKADGKGAKRKSIYEGFGFKAIPGLKGDKLWALKNQGKFTEIPENQFDTMRNMIRGDALEEKKPLRVYGPA